MYGQQLRNRFGIDLPYQGFINYPHTPMKKRTDLTAPATKANVQELRTEMLSRFDTVDKRFDKVDIRFDRMDKRMDKMDERFDVMDSQFTIVLDLFAQQSRDIHQSFEELSQKMDQQFYEVKSEIYAVTGNHERRLVTIERKLGIVI